MKKLLLLLSFSIFTIATNAQSVKWAQLQNVAAPPLMWGTQPPRITTDGDDLISTGQISTSITFGNQTLAGNNGRNRYLAKHGPLGNLLWARFIRGGIDPVVTTDSNKNIYLAGSYRDSLRIGNTSFATSGPNGNLFIAKFDPTGSLLWARSSNNHPTGFSYQITLSADANGNLFVAGGYQHGLSIGATTITPIGAEDIFLSKFDPNGNLQWLNTVGSQGQDSYPSIISGLSGDVYLTFNTRAWPTASVPEGHSLQKFNSAGVAQWWKFIPKWRVYHQPFISRDAADNIYLAATMDTTLVFGSQVLNHTSGAPNNTFLTKISSTGTWKWARKIQTGAANNYFSMESRAKNELNIINFEAAAQYTFNINLARLDTAGNVIKSSRFSNLSYYSPTDKFTVSQTATDNYGHTYFSGSVAGNMALGPVILNAPPAIPGPALPNPSAGFIAKMALDDAYKLSGTMFIDTNGDGLRDTWELPFPNGMVQLNPGPHYTTTATDGTYSVYVPAGTYTVQVAQPANHYTLLPLSHSVTFSANSQPQVRDFALTPIPNRNDVKVSINNLNPARPGFTTKYRLTFENIGITSLSDTITLRYNANYLSFNNATTQPVSQQPGKIKWFYQTLHPTQKRNIDIEFAVAAATPLGTNLRTYATIKPLVNDFYTENNYDTLTQVVTGSSDPNDKQVNHVVLSPAQVSQSPFLDYVIRFQNTGTDTAFTVVVRDTLSSHLQITSFELMSASHPYTFRLLENHIGEWRFNNILLPDSNRNERASHGYIRYRMKPKNNLMLGDEIKGKAAIYFDFNQPVITNDAITRIAILLGLEETVTDLKTFKLYPNPAKSYVIVAAEFKRNMAAKVTLVNMLGQKIEEVTLPANNQIHYQLQVNKLPKGVYIVQLETETGRQTQRLVIQ